MLNNKGTWLSLIGFCLLTVLGAALAFAAIVAGGSVALASHAVSEETQNSMPAMTQPSGGESFSGMLTDSRCGARHIRNSGLNPSECARACIRKGARYILVDGNRLYMLNGDENSLDKLVGTRVNVIGIRQGETILVSSAAAPF